MKLHNYPWFPADWLTSTTRFEMTEEQRGIYRDLLDHHYEEGSLPTNERALQGKAAASDKAWARSKEVVLSHFYERDGRLYHRKAEQVLASRKEWKDKQRSFGKAGAQKRWGASEDPDGRASSNANVARIQSQDPGASPQEDVDELSSIAQAIINRHPHPLKMRMKDFLQAVVSKQQPNESLADVIAEIDRNHRALCDLSVEDGGWKGGQIKYKQIPALRDWVWRSRDPTTTPLEPETKRPRTMEY